MVHFLPISRMSQKTTQKCLSHTVKKQTNTGRKHYLQEVKRTKWYYKKWNNSIFVLSGIIDRNEDLLSWLAFELSSIHVTFLSQW